MVRIRKQNRKAPDVAPENASPAVGGQLLFWYTKILKTSLSYISGAIIIHSRVLINLKYQGEVIS